ncbi:hypothetical protein OIO90_000341 [Microbotryomycetes sp. JL221]|nr:hypothetical protein OIO90_000341 [Microbotryomycetes sp. JL221]
MTRTISSPPMLMQSFALSIGSLHHPFVTPNLLSSPPTINDSFRNDASPPLAGWSPIVFSPSQLHVTPLTRSGNTSPTTISVTSQSETPNPLGVESTATVDVKYHLRYRRAPAIKSTHDHAFIVNTAQASSATASKTRGLGISVSENTSPGNLASFNASGYPLTPRDVLQDITESNESNAVGSVDSRSKHTSASATLLPLPAVRAENEPRVMINGHLLASLPPSTQLLMHKVLRHLLTDDSRYVLDEESIQTLQKVAPWFTESLTQIKRIMQDEKQSTDARSTVASKS